MASVCLFIVCGEGGLAGWPKLSLSSLVCLELPEIRADEEECRMKCEMKFAVIKLSVV